VSLAKPRTYDEAFLYLLTNSLTGFDLLLGKTQQRNPKRRARTKDCKLQKRQVRKENTNGRHHRGHHQNHFHLLPIHLPKASLPQVLRFCHKLNKPEQLVVEKSPMPSND
jgi:hypothetical protein